MGDITPARLQKVLQQLKNQSPLAGASKTEQIKNSLKDDTKRISNYFQPNTVITSTSFDCKPWDYSMFLRRVRTYQVMTWFAKPKKINPFACARFGWINCDFDMLECPSCKQRLLFSPSKQLTQQGVEDAAAAFLTQLETSHSEYCPWRNNPSPSHFTHLPYDQSKVLEQFSDRLKTFQSVSLPVLSEQAEERIKSLIDDKLDLLVDDREHKDAVKTAFLLAVCGWECVQEQDQHVIHCLQCQRQIALKHCNQLLEHKVTEDDVNITVRLLKESQHSANDGEMHASSPTQSPHSRKRERESAEGDIDSEQGPSKRARIEAQDNDSHHTSTLIPTSDQQDNNTTTTLQHTASPYNSPTATLVRDKPFDPVNEHRYFCPWINSYEESTQSSLVAWQKGLVALFSLPAASTDQVFQAPKSFSDFQTILNRIRAVVQTPNKSVNKSVHKL